MYDVVIIGGGPAGSTCATLLKKYRPDMKVLVLEREKFPREHVGESQLPPISIVLDEMGAWDKVEAANFPIKIGATYRWGNTTDLWDFEFLPAHLFEHQERPAKYEGFRKQTAFQVERSVYDKILLDHARECGVEVREETKVSEIVHTEGQIECIKLSHGQVIEAKYYVDASGSSGIMRRSLGINIVEPSSLRNIAFWDYWNDTEWAFSVGVGGTRVQVLSLGYGWIWFIPISPTRTSIGLVCPAEYFRTSGLTKEEVYHKALKEEPRLQALVKSAKADGEVRGTKDWSYYAEKMHGKNWFLVGEAAGFADPILAAGLTMAHVGARELAYTIIALENGEQDGEWLKEQLSENQTRRVKQHIQFADFWYTANGCFTDVKEHTRVIASEAGLELDANKAFQWLGTGGFLTENSAAGFSGCDLEAIIDAVELISDSEAEIDALNYNRFLLTLDGAAERKMAVYDNGQVYEAKSWNRGDQVLPQMGVFNMFLQLLQQGTDLSFFFPIIISAIQKNGLRDTERGAASLAIAHLEAMLKGGWVRGVTIPGQPSLRFKMPKRERSIKHNDDTFLTEVPA